MKRQLYYQRTYKWTRYIKRHSLSLIIKDRKMKPCVFVVHQTARDLKDWQSVSKAVGKQALLCTDWWGRTSFWTFQRTVYQHVCKWKLDVFCETAVSLLGVYTKGGRKLYKCIFKIHVMILDPASWQQTQPKVFNNRRMIMADNGILYSHYRWCCSSVVTDMARCPWHTV